jgi:REP element-mobilizing transposase RayT
MKKLRPHIQLALAARGTGKRGGYRAGSGRPRVAAEKQKGHIRRAAFAGRYPSHVTLRVRADVGSLRRAGVYAAIEQALVQGKERPGFRVVHYSVQGNHMHLVCEAADRAARARGMQALNTRLARAINRGLGRKGSVFAERYHARVLRTPTEVRNVLAYVYGNQHKHAAERGADLGRDHIDRCSSAAWFDGWKYQVREMAVHAQAGGTRPVSRPTVWLLTTGWRRLGLLPFVLGGAAARRCHIRE